MLVGEKTVFYLVSGVKKQSGLLGFFGVRKVAI